MTLDQLRIFLAVARHSHVTRAARDLNRTQSAVSAALSALQTNHGVRLFDHVGRGIVLTQAGRDFVDTAQALVAQADAAATMLDDLSTETRGLLRIWASQTIASYWLPRHLIALRELYPRVDLALTVDNTEHVARVVSEGAADLGFVEGAVSTLDLKRQVVAQDELVLVLSADHPQADLEQFTEADYLSLRWILREPGSGTRSEFQAHLATLGVTIDSLSVALELPSNEAILAAVSAGPYATMLSRRAVNFDKAAGALRIRPVTWAPRPERPFAVLFHPTRYQTKAAKALIALTQTHP